MKHLIFPFLILWGVGMAGCDETVQAQAGESFQINLGGHAELAGSPLKLSFVKVTEDSRCPKGVHCIWAGQVIAELHIEGKPALLTLPGGRDNAKAQTDSQGFRIELQAVNPYPEEGMDMNKAAYQATLKITRL